MINSNVKGKSGERDVVKLLNKATGRQYQRNLMQFSSSGCDIITDKFAIEVKRCNVIKPNLWQIQADNSAKHLNLIPVIIFRKDRTAWQAILKMNFNANEYWATISIEDFLTIFQKLEIKDDKVI